jgi:hypothetical protein
VTTFTLTGGALNFSVQDAAALTGDATGASSVSGSLGSVSVDDARGSAAGWVVSAISTSFIADAPGSSTVVISGAAAATEVSYTGGVATATSGNVTVAGGTVKVLDTAVTAPTAVSVMAGTLADGNNTASWIPSLTVGLPSNARAGDYTGTVTSSIL